MMKADAPFSTFSRQFAVAFSSARSVTNFQQVKGTPARMQALAMAYPSISTMSLTRSGGAVTKF